MQFFRVALAGTYFQSMRSQKKIAHAFLDSGADHPPSYPACLCPLNSVNPVCTVGYEDSRYKIGHDRTRSGDTIIHEEPRPYDLCSANKAS